MDEGLLSVVEKGEPVSVLAENPRKILILYNYTDLNGYAATRHPEWGLVAGMQVSDSMIDLRRMK